MKKASISPALLPNPNTRKARIALREKFLAQVGSIRSFQQAFNHLPGVYFCVKDLQSRLIWGNEALFQRLNVAEDDLPGTLDDEYFPRHISASFVRDDRRVFRTGNPILNKVAVWYSPQHTLDWFVKCKFPLLSPAGKVIGLIAIIQSYEGMKAAHTPFADINVAINYLRDHLHESISVEDIAQSTGISGRQLQRRFQRAFGMNVQRFLTTTRIQAAEVALLRTNQPISEIAQKFGFCDQSAFTRQFRENTGLTPRKFREQNALLR